MDLIYRFFTDSAFHSRTFVINTSIGCSTLCWITYNVQLHAASDSVVCQGEAFVYVDFSFLSERYRCDLRRWSGYFIRRPYYLIDIAVCGSTFM